MRRDFRQIIDLLESSGDLVRIKREVDPKFEMSAIMKKLEAEDKAFIFENIKNAENASCWWLVYLNESHRFDFQ